MKDFSELLCSAKALRRPVRVALAGAADPHALEALFQAADEGFAEPVLVDGRERLSRALETVGREGARVVNCHEGENPAQRAVELICAGEADFLMKGRLETRDILGPVVDRKNGLHTGRCMSMLTVNELPGYPKLLGLSDAGMVIYPTLEQKREIIENAVSVLRRLGRSEPRVAVLCGVEKTNPKMLETVEAEALQAMNREAVIQNCVVVGPISYDIAMSASIADYKGFDCPYCGDFDLLIVPTLAAGNLLNKCMTVSCGASMAGLVIGAKVPVVLTSRGSSAREKFYSIALAACASLSEEV